jgi:hypothetical protein
MNEVCMPLALFYTFLYNNLTMVQLAKSFVINIQLCLTENLTFLFVIHICYIINSLKLKR